MHDGLVAVREFEDGVLRVVAVHHRDADAVQVVQPRGGQYCEGRFADAPFLGGESDSYAFADSHTFVGRYGYKLSHTNFGIYADIYIRIRIAA